MKPTPRTDALILENDMADLELGHRFRNLANHARTLERELGEAVDVLKLIEGDIQGLMVDVLKLIEGDIQGLIDGEWEGTEGLESMAQIARAFLKRIDNANR